jgi:hypothetical protein
MSSFIRIWARPIGAEPSIFQSFAEADVQCQCTGHCSPWCVPHVVEFASDLEARRYLKEHYPTVYSESKGLGGAKK